MEAEGGFYLSAAGRDQAADQAALLLMAGQSGISECFLPCRKISWNGENRLFYMTDGCFPLSALPDTAGRADRILILLNLWDALLEFGSIGWLDHSLLILEPGRVYAEQGTWRIRLLYLAWRTAVKEIKRNEPGERECVFLTELLEKWFSPLRPGSPEGRLEMALKQRPVMTKLIRQRLLQLKDIEERRR